MKKIAAGIFILLFLVAAEVTYINYRLEHNLSSIELNQQNILTKVYSLERSTMQIQQSVHQIIQQTPKKQQPNSKNKIKFLLTSTDIQNENYENQELEGIN